MKLSDNASSNYDVIIRYNLLDQIDEYLDEFNSGQLFIICYSIPLLSKAEEIYVLLKNKMYSVELLEIPDGEQHKQFDNIQFISQSLIDLNVNRNAHAAGGTTSAAFVAAGFNPPGNIATTEDWTLGQNIKVLTD